MKRTGKKYQINTTHKFNSCTLPLAVRPTTGNFNFFLISWVKSGVFDTLSNSRIVKN